MDTHIQDMQQETAFALLARAEILLRRAKDVVETMGKDEKVVALRAIKNASLEISLALEDIAK